MSGVLKFLNFKPNKLEERFFNSVLYVSPLAVPSSIAAAPSPAANSKDGQPAFPGFTYLDDRVRIFKSSTKGYGLRAADGPGCSIIPKRTKIITVPKSVWEPYSARMILKQARESNPEFVTSLRQMAVSIFPNNKEQAETMESSLCMGLDIMLQAIDNDGAGSSDYISLLSGSSHPFNFDTLPHPLLMDDKYLRMIKGSQSYHQITLRQKMYRGIASRIFPDDPPKQIALVWAIGVILSRALSGSDRPFTLVPLLDLANHSGDLKLQNIEHDFGVDKLEFSVHTTRDVHPGEELFLTYGLQRDSTQLLTIYGFVDGGNVHNVNDKIRLNLDYNLSVKEKDAKNSDNNNSSSSSSSQPIEDSDYSISTKTLCKWKLEKLIDLMQNPKISIPTLKVYQSLAKNIGSKLESLDRNGNDTSTHSSSSSSSSKMLLELITNDWIIGPCGVGRSITMGQDLLETAPPETSKLVAKLNLILLSSKSNGGDGNSQADILAGLDITDLVGLEAIICDCMQGRSGWVKVLKDAGIQENASNIKFISHVFVKLFNYYFGHNLLIPMRLASLSRQDLSARLGESYCAEDLDELSPEDVFGKSTELLVIRKLMTEIDRQIGGFIDTSSRSGSGDSDNDIDSHDHINKMIQSFLACTSKTQLESLESKYILSSSAPSSSTAYTNSNTNFNASPNDPTVVDPYAYWSKYIAPVIVGRELGALWSLRSHLEIYEFSVESITDEVAR